jgi:hypothetical protein
MRNSGQVSPSWESQLVDHFTIKKSGNEMVISGEKHFIVGDYRSKHYIDDRLNVGDGVATNSWTGSEPNVGRHATVLIH